jgi:hypothetical protein
MSREAMKMALEALENPWEAGPDGVADAIIALRQALETGREWVGLTDQEINSVCYKRDWTAPWTNTTFARAIEAKLREKNGGEYRNGATTERTKLSQENT